MKYSHGAIALIVASMAVSPIHANIVLEPFSYRQDFETQELSAWASYPLWQDTSCDPNFSSCSGKDSLHGRQFGTAYGFL